MSASITILHIADKDQNTLTLDCYLIDANGSLRYKFDDEKTLKINALTLLISLIQHIPSDLPLKKMYPEYDSAYYSFYSMNNIDSVVAGVALQAYNLDYDIDILDDHNHPEYPNINAMLPLNRTTNFPSEIVSMLSRVSLSIQFVQEDMLSGIPVGYWDFSALDTDLGYYM